jgi:hydrogenase small subunit
MPGPSNPPTDTVVHVLWINAGLSCDGDSVSLTAATQPSVEDIALGALPGLPTVQFHWPLVDYQVGDDFMEWFWKADAGTLDPFVLVVEGSIPNEAIKNEGYWTGFGNRGPGPSKFSDQPMTTSEWLDRLAPRALAVVCAGTCATYGGIHAMAGNPTGAMGVPDYLGWNWRSKAGIPIVCVPGCPVQPDNLSETLLYLLYQATGQAAMIPLDEALRPTWLFGRTVHEGCDRAGYYEQGDFAHEYGSPKCIVKIGCWGPVVKCNVTKRGWMAGIGGCPNVGGICIGCTMPGFPDKFMPFMDEPPGSKFSTAASGLYGGMVRALRQITMHSVDKEPKWRQKGIGLQTGYSARARRIGDDSVTVAADGHPEYAGKSITRRAEEFRDGNPEPGRYRTPPARQGERPGGQSTARDSSGVGPQDPIDKRMPNLRP